MSDVRSVAVIAYNRCGEQDTLVPWEILRSLAWVLSQQKRELSVELVGVEKGNVNMQMGLQVIPQSPLTPTNTFDLLYVPGGLGSGEASRDARILDLVRRHHAGGKIIATNCSGISILHRAGILEGRPVTCPATVSRRLLEEGVKVVSPRRMWLGSSDGRVWTSAGGSGVHGSTVAMIAHHFGKELGLKMALTWDTMGALGDALFRTEGPEYGVYPDHEKEVQDQFEDQLLPRADKQSATAAPQKRG